MLDNDYYLKNEFNEKMYREMGYGDEKIEEFRNGFEHKKKAAIMEAYQKNINEIRSILERREQLLVTILSECLVFSNYTTELFLEGGGLGISSNYYKKWLAFAIGFNHLGVNDFKLESFQRYKYPKSEDAIKTAVRIDDFQYVNGEILEKNIRIMIKQDKSKVLDYFLGFVKNNTGTVLRILKYSEKYGNNDYDFDMTIDYYWAEHNW